MTPPATPPETAKVACARRDDKVHRTSPPHANSVPTRRIANLTVVRTQSAFVTPPVTPEALTKRCANSVPTRPLANNSTESNARRHRDTSRDTSHKAEVPRTGPEPTQERTARLSRGLIR